MFTSASFLQSEVESLQVFLAVSCRWIDSVWQSGNFPNLQSPLYVWTGKYSDPATQGETPNSPSYSSSSLWMMCALQWHRWHLKVIVCQGSYTAYQWQNKCLLSCLRTWWIGSLGRLSAPTSRDWNQTSFPNKAGHSWTAPCIHWSRHETGEEDMLDRSGSRMSRCPEISIRKQSGILLGWVTNLCTQPSEVWHLCKWHFLICIFYGMPLAWVPPISTHPSDIPG